MMGQPQVFPDREAYLPILTWYSNLKIVQLSSTSKIWLLFTNCGSLQIMEGKDKHTNNYGYFSLF
jgi:hypothetical protein